MKSTFANFLEKNVMSTEAQEFVSRFEKDCSLMICKVARPDFVVIITATSKISTGAGIGYGQQLWIFLEGKIQMEEWVWRDAYDSKKDQPHLSVCGIAEVSTEEKLVFDYKTGLRQLKKVADVVLENAHHGNRTISFSFDIEKIAVSKLDEKQQADFQEKMHSEISTMLAAKSSYSEKKPAEQVDYEKPVVFQEMSCPALGLGVFIIKEQIDHRDILGAIFTCEPANFVYELYITKSDCAPLMLCNQGLSKKEQDLIPFSVSELSAEKLILSANKKEVVFYFDVI
jgi:hypothetical protein